MMALYWGLVAGLCRSQVESAVAVARSVLVSRSLSCWGHPQPASLHCGDSVRASAVHMCAGWRAQTAGLSGGIRCRPLPGGRSPECQHRTQRSLHLLSAPRRPACPQPPNLSYSRPPNHELSHSRLPRVHICPYLRPLLRPKADGQRAVGRSSRWVECRPHAFRGHP